MATILAHHPVLRQSPTPPPDEPHLSLETIRPSSTPIPNKHLPFCPSGPAPPPQQQGPTTPPDTPPFKNSPLRTFSLFQHPAVYPKIIDSPPVYSIDASTLDDALNVIATQSFPDPKHTFPWLHGLHHNNHMQLAFFTARRKPRRNAPKCLRGITIVKVGGDLTKARLKGAISPQEVLDLTKRDNAEFLEVDPQEGFSVRNFQIQAAKMAMVSDVVVYGDVSVNDEDVLDLAKKIATAQGTWRVKNRFVDDEDAPNYDTFVLSSSFEEVEETHPHLIAVDSEGDLTGHSLDFSKQILRRTILASGP
ncbi:MAG: hypothetical protein Q9164_005615 [Protoblastenia rupestris]